MDKDTQVPAVSMSETLVGIRLRAGYSPEDLAAYLEVPLPRLQSFEACRLSDQWLVDRYGELARQRTYVRREAP